MSKKKRQKLKRFLKEKFFLRFHMFLILSGTFLAGLLVTKLLLIAKVDAMLIRYPVAVLLSYLVFFGLIKLWLLYLASTSGTRRAVDNTIGDAGSSIIPDLSPGGSVIDTGPIGGGGEFGGGGVTGSFGDAVEVTGEGIGEAAGEAASGVLEDAGIFLVIIGVLLAVIFGVGMYAIYEAPYILSEAAFEFFLATGLVRSAKRMDHVDWVGSIFKTTWIPFLVATFVAIICALIVNMICPEAVKLAEVFRAC